MCGHLIERKINKQVYVAVYLIFTPGANAMNI